MIPEWKQRAYIERLQKRMDHLAKRIEGKPNLTYDVAELNALKWAIRTLRDIYNL